MEVSPKIVVIQYPLHQVMVMEVMAVAAVVVSAAASL